MPGIEKGRLNRFLIHYGLAICAVAGGFMLRLIIMRDFGPGLPTYITFYPAVMLAAILGGFLSGLVATTISVLIAVYWILPPVGKFAIESPLDAVGVVLFSAMGVFMSGVAELYRRNREKVAFYNKEMALRENEQRWATILASIGDAVIATDMTGKIIFMNGIAQELTGWGFKEASRKPVVEVFNIINEQTREKVENPFNKVLEEGNIVFVANHTALVRKDGTELPIDDSGAPIRDLSGKIAGVVLVFRDITERKRAEEELRRNRDELEDRGREKTAKLQESGQRLRQLSTELLSTQEKERRLVAQEIHDSIGAPLAATKFKVESALAQISADNPQTRALLESVLPIIQEAANEAGRIQMNLRPSILDDLGILATIDWLCRQYESTYFAIRVKQEVNIQEQQVSDSLKTVISRVLQEALNNAAKHSKANEVLLALRKTDQAIQLVVRDNGHGFSVEDILSRKGSDRGLGLDSMRERTELAGGTFAIESRDSGTVIQASWPL